MNGGDTFIAVTKVPRRIEWREIERYENNSPNNRIIYVSRLEKELFQR